MVVTNSTICHCYLSIDIVFFSSISLPLSVFFIIQCETNSNGAPMMIGAARRVWKSARAQRQLQRQHSKQTETRMANQKKKIETIDAGHHRKQPSGRRLHRVYIYNVCCCYMVCMCAYAVYNISSAFAHVCRTQPHKTENKKTKREEKNTANHPLVASSWPNDVIRLIAQRGCWLCAVRLEWKVPNQNRWHQENVHSRHTHTNYKALVAELAQVGSSHTHTSFIYYFSFYLARCIVVMLRMYKHTYHRIQHYTL